MSLRSFPVNAADTAWLRMEEPTNPMTITGVIGFDGPMSLAAMRRFMAERLVPFDRFRMRVDTSTGRPRWVPDDRFDVAHHVVEADLPAPGGKDGLQRLVGQLMSEAVDLTRAPWTIHLVADAGDGRSAAVVRLHHVIGDGIALMHVLISASDEYHDPTKVQPRRRAARRPLTARIGQTLRGAAGEAVELLASPRRLGRRVATAGSVSHALAALLLMRPDSPTVFKGRATPEKRAAWTEPLALDRIKAIGRATGAKVNDVLMAVAAGALRGYLLELGHPVRGVEVRVATPFNVRPLDRAHELGNSFGLAFVALPIAEASPAARLREVQARMNAVKDSFEPAVTFGILQSIGAAPMWAHRQVVEMFAQKASAVLTNVPGPAEPVHIEGVGVDSLMFWVPQAGDIGLGISILSMNGTVRVGIAADAAYVPDPGRLAEAFSSEIDRLSDALTG